MKRGVFLDRDGVINAMVYDPDHGIIDSPTNLNQFRLLPGAGEAIKGIKEMGFLAVVISNQPGIAKDKFSLEILQAIDKKMKEELAQFGAHLDKIYYCFHHPEAIKKEYRKNSSYRKPNPGLLLKAAEELKIDLTSSYMIGDGLTDVQAGKRAGCKTILLGRLKCDLCKMMEDLEAKPDLIASDLSEAVKLIEKVEGEQGEDIH